MKFLSVLLFAFLFTNLLYATGDDLQFHHLSSNISFIDGSRHFGVSLINAHRKYYENSRRYGKVRVFIVVYEKPCNSASTCNGPSKIVDNTWEAVQLGKAQSTSISSKVYIAPKYKTAQIRIFSYPNANEKVIYLNLRNTTHYPCVERSQRTSRTYITKVDYIKEDATALITVKNRSSLSQRVRFIIRQNGRKGKPVSEGHRGTIIPANKVQVVKLLNVDPYPWLDEMRVKMIVERGNKVSEANQCFTSFNNFDYLQYLNSTGDRIYTVND